MAYELLEGWIFTFLGVICGVLYTELEWVKKNLNGSMLIASIIFLIRAYHMFFIG